MDKDYDKSTEQKILDAATVIFIREGFAGARMQAIADYAGINKALLHYYFRSKDKLFETFFHRKFLLLTSKFQLILNDKLTFWEKIDKVIDAYIDMLSENPYLPTLVFSTIHHHPEFLQPLPKTPIQALLKVYQTEVHTGRIKPIPAAQFFMSLVGLCFVPYIAKPMMMHIMDIPEKEFLYLLEQRRALIKSVARSILMPV